MSQSEQIRWHDEPPSSLSTTAVTLAIMVIAVAIRLPSCFESFWLDELHSAWCIWDSLSDVSPRARAGNQSPIYFWGLWFWRQCWGDSEVALRASSVLAVSLACGAMSLGVTKWCNSLIAGTVAGLVLAIEANSIFYGTELRPYAWVILASTVATLCFLRVFQQHHLPVVNQVPLIGMSLAILVAVLAQPTSLASLGWLFVAWAAQKIVRRQFRILGTKVEWMLLAIGLLVGTYLWQTTLGHTWNGRSDWAVFAKVDQNANQVFGPQQWLGLMVVPGLLLAVKALGLTFLQRVPKEDQLGSERKLAWARLQTIGIVLTVCWISVLGFALASRFGGVHLFHRRYMISLIPMLALGAGASLSKISPSIPLPGSGIARVVLAATFVIGLAWSQRVLPTAFQNPSLLAKRGEDWRWAVQTIMSKPSVWDWGQIQLDADLLEARRYLNDRGELEINAMSLSEREYLTFPLRGPYRVNGIASDAIVPIAPNQGHPENTVGTLPPTKTLIIRRRKLSALDSRWQEPPYHAQSFGNVSVLGIAP